MSPIRSRPFSTKINLGQQKAVLDGNMRSFSSSIDVGRSLPLPEVPLKIRLVETVDWETPSYAGDGSMITYNNRARQFSSTNKDHGSTGYIYFAVNKFCTLGSAIRPSSQTGQDVGRIHVSAGSKQRINQPKWTAPISQYSDSDLKWYAISSNFSGSQLFSFSKNLKTNVSDLLIQYNNDYDYDIGDRGDSEMLIRIRYEKNNDGISSNNDEIEIDTWFFNYLT